MVCGVIKDILASYAAAYGLTSRSMLDADKSRAIQARSVFEDSPKIEQNSRKNETSAGRYPQLCPKPPSLFLQGIKEIIVGLSQAL
jgi:hypothetical protein